MSGSSKPLLANELDGLARAVARVRMNGDAKHGIGTWRGLDPSEFVQAATRHLAEMAAGRMIDEESGEAHAAHVAVNMQLLYALTHAPQRAPLPALLRLEHVQRWHTLPVSRSQSVAEHSYCVAVIAARLADLIGRADLRPEVHALALVHDAAECVTGDAPPQSCPPLDLNKPLSRQVVKVADMLDAERFLALYGTGPECNAARCRITDWFRTLPERLTHAAAKVRQEMLGPGPYPGSVSVEEAKGWQTP